LNQINLLRLPFLLKISVLRAPLQNSALPAIISNYRLYPCRRIESHERKAGRLTLLKTTVSVNGQPSSGKRKSSSDAARSIAGSEDRWREEVMPGKNSGEVMLTLARQEGKTKRVR